MTNFKRNTNMITGKNYIGDRLSGSGEVNFKTFNPSLNTENSFIFTEASSEEIQEAVDLAWEAFMDYRQRSVTLSGDEVRVLSLLNGGREEEANKLLIEAGFTARDGDTVKPTLEGRELAGKMESMGIQVPWEKKGV